MSWIDFREKKPETDVVAIVMHEKGWMFNAIATYYKYNDVWVLSNPQMSAMFTLEVTHYLPIPDYPEK